MSSNVRMNENENENDLKVGVHILTQVPNVPHRPHQWIVQFENDYGASVITGPFALCNDTHPYELAVLHDNHLCYSTSITNDVMGYLDLQEVESTLDQIAQLPSNKRCTHDHPHKD